MGLKCSLLGHDFGDTEIEREREEEGDEVVLISREIETCSRCGESRVVSENKEVTTVQPEEEVGAPDTETESGTDGLDSAIERVEADEEFEPPQSPEEDDAVILDAEESEPEREPGEWPDGEEPAEEPAEVEESEPESAAEAEAEAESDAEAAAEAEDTEVWSGEMPGDEPADTEPAGPTISSEPGPDVDTDAIPEDSFYCPECGFSEPVAGSSLRAGDACPDCHRGYLERK